MVLALGPLRAVILSLVNPLTHVPEEKYWKKPGSRSTTFNTAPSHSQTTTGQQDEKHLRLLWV